MSPKPLKRRRRGVVDTSVVAAGVAGFKAGVTLTNDSARLIRDWMENDTFVWLVSADIVDEYKAVLGRLAFAPRSSEQSSTCCGKKLNRSSRQDPSRPSPTQETHLSGNATTTAVPISSSRLIQKIFRKASSKQRSSCRASHFRRQLRGARRPNHVEDGTESAVHRRTTTNQARERCRDREDSDRCAVARSLCFRAISTISNGWLRASRPRAVSRPPLITSDRTSCCRPPSAGCAVG